MTKGPTITLVSDLILWAHNVAEPRADQLQPPQAGPVDTRRPHSPESRFILPSKWKPFYPH